MTEKMFVYGSYREGYYNHGRHINRKPDCYALARGFELYYMPDDNGIPECARHNFHPECGFPVLCPTEFSGQSCVFGEVYTLSLDIIKTLDQLMGIDNPETPESELYSRRRIDVLTDRGDTVEVWAYVRGTETRFDDDF